MNGSKGGGKDKGHSEEDFVAGQRYGKLDSTFRHCTVVHLRKI